MVSLSGHFRSIRWSALGVHRDRNGILGLTCRTLHCVDDDDNDGDGGIVVMPLAQANGITMIVQDSYVIGPGLRTGLNRCRYAITA